MRKFRFFGLLAVAGLFAACSNDDVVSNENTVAAEGDGYVSFAINLPTTPASRAANDVFDDGTSNEYAVYDATLILFEGANEATATLSSAYNLNLNFNTDASTTDNITSTAKVVQKLNDPLATGNNFYAMVVLNSNDQLTVDANKLKVNGTDVTTSGDYTLAKFITDTKIDVTSKEIVKGDGTKATQFFMANAPLFTKAGGTTDPTGGATQTLVQLNTDNIKSTEAEAVLAPAAEINVERAVAKVSLTMGATGKTTAANLEYKVLGWALDNTNTESYLVRNVDGFNAWTSYSSNGLTTPNYRFVGSVAVPATSTTATTLYRTYWGKDPNYTSTAANGLDGTGVSYWDENTANFADKFVAVDQPAYCAENTFDVANQKDINTTAAIIKVQFKPTNGNWNDDFYTVNKDESTLYTRDEVIKYIKSAFLSNPAISTALKAKQLAGTTIGEADITVTLGTADQGLIGVTKITVDKSKIEGTTAGSAATEDLDASTLAVGTTFATNMINKANTIRKYKDGIAYYSVLIKHFGDDLTPWKNGETEAPTVTDIYPATNANANYLGRYGVLRNNWYSISVTSVKNLGTPTVPSLGKTSTPGTPDGPDGPTDPKDPDSPDHGGYDDNMNQYLSVKINVLSWAKRVQDVVL